MAAGHVPAGVQGCRCGGDGADGGISFDHRGSVLRQGYILVGADGEGGRGTGVAVDVVGDERAGEADVEAFARSEARVCFRSELRGGGKVAVILGDNLVDGALQGVAFQLIAVDVGFVQELVDGSCLCAGIGEYIVVDEDILRVVLARCGQQISLGARYAHGVICHLDVADVVAG